MGDVLAIQYDLAVHHPAGLFEQAQYGPAGLALATAGFAHQPEGLALVDFEGHAVHGLDQLVASREIRLEVLDLQYPFRHADHRPFLRSMSVIESPSRLRPTPVIASTRPGKKVIHEA